MLLEVIESMNEKIVKYYPSLATWQSSLDIGKVKRQKMLEIMECLMENSHLIGKTDNNYSQFWK